MLSCCYIAGLSWQSKDWSSPPIARLHNDSDHCGSLVPWRFELYIIRAQLAQLAQRILGRNRAMKLNTHQINITYWRYINIRYWINTRRNNLFMSTTEVIWKPSHFFTSFTNKLQESRCFSIDSPIHRLQPRGETRALFLQPKQRKTTRKKSLLVFLAENQPAFAVLFVGKNVPFSLCKFQPWKSSCVLLGVVWCPGFAEAPMPGSLSRGTGQGEGGLHREVVPKEKVLRQSWLQSGLGVKRR